MSKSKVKIYLDDTRIPGKSWIHVSSYDEFVNEVLKHNLEDIEEISFDHDLGDNAITEFFNSVYQNENPTFNYDNLQDEKTGMHCAKYFVDNLILSQINNNPDLLKKLPRINVHSANPVGKQNIISYFESFYKAFNISQTVTINYYNHTYEL